MKEREAAWGGPALGSEGNRLVPRILPQRGARTLTPKSADMTGEPPPLRERWQFGKASAPFRGRRSQVESALLFASYFATNGMRIHEEACNTHDMHAQFDMDKLQLRIAPSVSSVLDDEAPNRDSRDSGGKLYLRARFDARVGADERELLRAKSLGWMPRWDTGSASPLAVQAMRPKRRIFVNAITAFELLVPLSNFRLPSFELFLSN